jgi:hypothetical protein
MVNEPEYPNGLPLFTYTTPERAVTICLTYPTDGRQPPSLAVLKDEAAREIQRIRAAGQEPDPFLLQIHQALEKLMASRTDPSLS